MKFFNDNVGPAVGKVVDNTKQLFNRVSGWIQSMISDRGGSTQVSTKSAPPRVEPPSAPKPPAPPSPPSPKPSPPASGAPSSGASSAKKARKKSKSSGKKR